MPPIGFAPLAAQNGGIPLLPDWATSPALTAVLLILLALSVAWMIRQQRHRAPGHSRRRATVAVRVAAVTAVGCTAYSADTNWRFAADYLDMASTTERAFMFAIAELALFSTALMARQNLNGPRRAPGLPGVLVWVITAGQLIPAYAVFGPVGGTVRALIGPFMAAMLWHLAMGIELRHRTPDAASRSLAAILIRQARERLLARLGIADQDADAARLISERALSQAVTLILRAEAMTDEQRGKWRGRRLAERLHQALERAEVDGDPLQDALLLRKLATRQQALGLASIPLPPRWHTPTSYPARDVEHGRSRAGAPKRAEVLGHAHSPDADNEGADRAARPHPARPEPEDRPGPSSSDRPEQPGHAVTDAERDPGKDTDANPGKTAKAKTKRSGRKPDVSDEALTSYARQILRKTGSLTRDQLKARVHADELSVATDRAADIVRAIKAELKDTARADHPH
ncbi:hypothetical protein ABTZ59_07915 [Streptomyces sp. NPDC094034]|uniref:hypothetical protein n=1 Tax=Streptomyces sp. NPDC094034 TaxID=3155309 RepID=UPI00333023AE